MNSVIAALISALRTMLHPKMLSLLLWPMLAALTLWVGTSMLFWGSWVAGLTSLLQATPLQHWMEQGHLAVVSHYLIAIILVLLLFPAIYATALVITATFAMPMMINQVAQKHFPGLERKQGGSTAGSVANTVIAVAVYGLGWIISLPLWLFFSPIAIVLPVVLFAYLNQRLFRYDALAEHASKQEFAQIVGRSKRKLYLLGVAVGILQFVPLLNLFMPIYVGLAFIHLCMAELKQLRQSA